ncbi:hypothetical protein [Mycolicibacterium gadium]|uniref:Lipoprotein n=1 Tax=Mycolicibacterium gadium TaxID=1794 RepID=A0ABT6GYV7_MYCGU|nr:hypothetical protein [Mycolicibacterium gadium]MDG5486686.1 hypothetical protein [Mycolicibacterium gadium]
MTMLVPAVFSIGLSACGSADPSPTGGGPTGGGLASADQTVSTPGTVNYDSPEEVADMQSAQAKCVNLPTSEEANACVREIVLGTTITMHGTVQDVLLGTSLQVVNDNPNLYTNPNPMVMTEDHVSFECPRGVAGCSSVKEGDAVYIVAKMELVDGLPTAVVQSVAIQ